MFFWFGKNNRKSPLPSVMNTQFSRYIVLAVVLRLMALIMMFVSNYHTAIPDFLGRVGVQLLFTFLHVPLWFFAGRKLSQARLSFVLLHVVNIASYPVESILYGSLARDCWLFFLLAHITLCLVTAYDTRKALAVGASAFVMLIGGMALDLDAPGFNHAAMISLMGVVCFSVIEFMMVRMVSQLQEKDARILDLARQNETGLRMLSHDMANILAVANDTLELAMEEIEDEGGKVTDQSVAFLDDSRFAVSQGIGMLHATRDYLAVFSGKKDPGMSTFLLSGVLKDVVQMWQRAAGRKNLTLALSLQVDPLATLVAGSRPVFTHTIVGNLVSNAIKFSPEKSVILMILAQDSDPQYFVVEVRDQGAGIPDSKLRSLFDSDAKTSSAGTGGEVGTGFGLPLVKSTLEVFGGEIILLNKGAEKTLGTCFRCRFPKAAFHGAPCANLSDLGALGSDSLTPGERKVS